MDRREFTTLLCMLPLLGIKPTPPNHKLYCTVCGKEMGEVIWPAKVKVEGTTWCEAHANRPDGRGLIENYHLDFYQDYTAKIELKRQQAEYDHERELRKMAKEIVDRERALYQKFYDTDPDHSSLDLHAELSLSESSRTGSSIG